MWLHSQRATSGSRLVAKRPSRTRGGSSPVPALPGGLFYLHWGLGHSPPVTGRGPFNIEQSKKWVTVLGYYHPNTPARRGSHRPEHLKQVTKAGKHNLLSVASSWATIANNFMRLEKLYSPCRRWWAFFTSACVSVLSAFQPFSLPFLQEVRPAHLASSSWDLEENAGNSVTWRWFGMCYDQAGTPKRIQRPSEQLFVITIITKEFSAELTKTSKILLNLYTWELPWLSLVSLSFPLGKSFCCSPLWRSATSAQ